MRSHPLLWLVAVASLLVLQAPRLVAQPAGVRNAAATENELSTREALAQIQAGGNAVDAAVTAALVAGVASPTSSGIGGGGFALVWMAADGKPFFLDFRETAPVGVDVAAFEKRPFAKAERGKATGVPGEIAGLFELHRRFGKRAWKDVVEPAARIAKSGFSVNPHLGSMLVSYGKELRQDAGIERVFYPHGKPAAVGSLVQRDKLAATLSKIAAEGPSGFYQGAVASDVVDAARSAGGSLTGSELAGYKPVERQPLELAWEGYRIFTAPPPSAGGLMLAETLKLFSRAELQKLGHGSGAYQHVLAEALRGAIADRMRYLGDPAEEKVDVPGLLAASRLARRKQVIARDRTHAIPRFGLEEHGTHHMVVADAAGNVVTLTSTVNHVFGAKLAGTASGVVLNDELDDFSKQSEVAPFGLSESPNRPRPGARPVSSMTPTLVVRDGQVVLAIGGSGGTAIATNVTQLLLGRLVFDDKPADLVKAPRFYVPTTGETIQLEKAAPAGLREELEWRGEVVGTLQSTSAVQLIAIDRGRKIPAADPRKHGSALTR